MMTAGMTTARLTRVATTPMTPAAPPACLRCLNAVPGRSRSRGARLAASERKTVKNGREKQGFHSIVLKVVSGRLGVQTARRANCENIVVTHEMADKSISTCLKLV